MKRLTRVVKSVRDSLVWHFLGDLFDPLLAFAVIFAGGLSMYDGLVQRDRWLFASGLFIAAIFASLEILRRVRQAVHYAREQIIAEVHRDREAIIAEVQGNRHARH